MSEETDSTERPGRQCLNVDVIALIDRAKSELLRVLDEEKPVCNSCPVRSECGEMLTVGVTADGSVFLDCAEPAGEPYSIQIRLPREHGEVPVDEPVDRGDEPF